jgi:hypothetical protein
VGMTRSNSLTLPTDYRATDPRAIAEWALFKTVLK